MNYRWIESVDEFVNIAKQWDKAVFLSGQDNPFLLSDFILAWWKHYGEDLKLRILVIYQDSKIVGGLPLCRYRNGYLEHAGGINANYTEFIPHEDSLFCWDILFDALSKKKDWRCVNLKRFRKKAIAMDRLRSLATRHKDILLDAYDYDYGYLINIPEDFRGYRNHLPKKLRYYVKRAEDGFASFGKINLYTLKGREEIDEACDKYINFSRSSFRRRNKRSAFEDKAYCCLFKELVNRFYDIGFLDANVLKLDDKIIAAHFGYSIGNNLNYIFTAFDINFASLNPGHLLIYKLLELGSQRKNKLFNLYAGSHLYKQQWSNYKEELISIQIRPNSVSGRLEKVMAKQARGSLIIKGAKEALRLSPALLDLARSIRSGARKYV